MGKADKTINEIGVLLDDINSKFDFALEVLTSVKEKTDEIPLMSLRLSKVESDIKVIKAAAIRTNQNVAGHDAMLRRLKAKPA